MNMSNCLLKFNDVCAMQEEDDIWGFVESEVTYKDESAYCIY